MDLTKQFVKYVSQNIFGLLGTSCYILADTYFIAQAAGTDGVTLLNLCLPIYNFIFAIGSMIGLGAATRYAILRAQGDEKAQRYFSNAVFCACILAVPFVLAGIFCPDGLLRLMGGDRASWRWARTTPASFCSLRPSSCATMWWRLSSATTATLRWPWWRR